MIHTTANHPENAPDLTASNYSRFAQRIRRRYAGELGYLPPGAPQRVSMDSTLSALRAQGLEAGAALRVLRQLVTERLLVLDCDVQPGQITALKLVTDAMTALAELALDVAVRESSATLDAIHGAPQIAGSNGEPDHRAQIWIVGMGKLGARELNVSSDIDLIYVYDQDGETAGDAQGQGKITNHEYFALQVKAIYALIGETTEHGFVFRVDLALRPHGGSGPAAISLSALEDYFQTQGREWERFAWLKSRVVAPQECLDNNSAQAMRSSVLPFVFRRYLDYNVFDALRTLHRQIREHAAKRSAGHPERANDVKISRGGIREIEFTVQLLQVVRGGQFPELRTRSTIDALSRLAHAGLMPQESADALAEAYTFLRRVEHRIQYLDDQQTHALPTRDEDLAWIAQTLNYPNCANFLSDLDTHREFVAEEFDKLLGGKPVCKSCTKNSCVQLPLLDELLGKPPEKWPEQFRKRLSEWRQNSKVLSLRDDSRARLAQLILRTADWLNEEKVSELAAIRLLDWMESLLRRESYLALLLERPAVHERMLRMLGAARWPASYLLLHPGVIDELADNEMLHQRFDGVAFCAALEQRMAALKRTNEDDEETSLNLLRRAHHAEVFCTLARDIEGLLTVEQVADDLSALANAVLATSAHWCWQRLKVRHRDDPALAIIAYGKLGGRELGYGGDLDLVFVYEDDHEQASEIYAAFVRKLINWLSVKTDEGDLFEIDTELRPNGHSGLLVTSFDAFTRYQLQRGNNTAWTWEHQAMTRAHCVLGDERLRERFEQIRLNVISAKRDRELLLKEIENMRTKVHAAHPVRGGKFDVKHSQGGMLDAEFAVQFLVLTESGQHSELAQNMGNITLMMRAEAAGLLPVGVGQRAADAYRQLRRVQHRARLNEEATQVMPPALASERLAITALWDAVFKG